ncbi:MAG: molybdopterin-guanine dinucleotide biosynthesis protein B [Nitrospinae bacterium]|nr:molybdopterin-guanine dinucleotide biosynthesis protein B [Nitrospinota bacterium]MDA1110760.1 molybdopterin-guanine dinucleotide biosynthesis protein B [Nitrospinota bacterium]
MDVYWEQFKTPFLCFAGYSGVGKTTLLEDLIGRFSAENFSVGYYKHDAHRFSVDKEGKDTFRTREAGAGIIAINDPKHFAMVGDNNFRKLTITHALEQCDCILIEGYKQSPFNKVVFLDAAGCLPIPVDTPGIKAVVHQGVIADKKLEALNIPLFHRDDLENIYEFVRGHFISCASALNGAVFVGGQSKRMGKPKFSLSYNGVSETERMVKVLNQFCEKIFLSSRSDLDMGPLANMAGEVERVNDDHIGLGPVGGLATLMAAHPDKAWMITACDMPFLDEKNFEFIINERDPLRYGTCFIQKGRRGFEPMCAIYEPKFILPLYEAMSRRELSLSRIISELPFKQVKIPDTDRYNFMNINTPEEYEVARVKREQEIAEI